MQKLALIFAIISISIAGWILPASAQSSDELVRVESIAIAGNRRVAESTILSYLPVQVGDRVSQGSLSIALQRLFETDLFKNCLLYTSPSPRDATLSRMPSSA